MDLQCALRALRLLVFVFIHWQTEMEMDRRKVQARIGKYSQSISHTPSTVARLLTPPPTAFSDETSFIRYSSACAVIHPFGCHIGCQMRFTLFAPFQSSDSHLQREGQQEFLLMCVSPSHLNSLVVRTHGANESETVSTSFLSSGSFLSRTRATRVHLIRGERLIKRWNERVSETLISGTSF